MYEDFRTVERWTGSTVHCVYQCIIMAIATRHADAVDVKFLVNDRPVWIALAHPAWAEHQRQTGHVITDPLAVEIAGHYLRTILEDGEESGRDLYTLSTAETLQHLDAVLKAGKVLAS
ncbi:MAG TPA: hypothetical protein VM578_07915 [Candidatus Saccharimonadales bacterium]|nr:hypothetical protein [Candidatus Saccharimonadales bacterium]